MRIVTLLLALTLAAAAQDRRNPPGTTVHRNLTYSGNLKLDLYLPAKTEAPLPLVVWIHGGGWRRGSKEGCPARFLTAHGFAVASVNYRLTGEAIFPAQIHDCKAAIRWLRANAERYKLDRKRFGAWGSSAGGHLAALLGTSGGVKELEGEDGNLDVSSAVQAVVSFAGPADFTHWRGSGADTAPRGLLGDPPQKQAAAASPVTYAGRGDPPFYIVHGSEDRTVPVKQARLMHGALKRAGVNSYLHIIEGAGHGVQSPQTQLLVQLFFERNLK